MNIISLITFRYIRGSRVFGLLSLKSRLSFIVMMVGVSLLIVVRQGWCKQKKRRAKKPIRIQLSE
jgi:ABC-type lipoprotein release transport system permease subunit